MSVVQVTVTPEVEEREKDDVLKVFDEDIERFSRYMAELDSPARGALNNPERALLKTYLVAKLREKF